MRWARKQAPHKRAVRLACLAAVLIGVSGPAHAHSDSLDVDVRAKIKERCGFTPSAVTSVDAPRDLENAAKMTIAVGLDCNTPYAIGVTSERGALVNVDARDDGSGFAFIKRYRVSVALETDRGIVRSEFCSSSDMTPGGRCHFATTVPGEGLKSGRGISVGRNAVISIDWPSQSALPRRLAAGRYKDTLILVVGPRA